MAKGFKIVGLATDEDQKTLSIRGDSSALRQAAWYPNVPAKQSCLILAGFGILSSHILAIDHSFCLTSAVHEESASRMSRALQFSTGIDCTVSRFTTSRPRDRAHRKSLAAVIHQRCLQVLYSRFEVNMESASRQLMLQYGSEAHFRQLTRYWERLSGKFE